MKLSCLALVLSLPAALAGCTGGARSRLETSPNNQSFRKALPAPTADDVALVDGEPLTLSSFLHIRELLRTRSKLDALWAGKAVLALRAESRALGRELPAPLALNVARYAMGELPLTAAESDLRSFLETRGALPPQEEMRRRIETLLSRSVIRENLLALDEVR